MVCHDFSFFLQCQLYCNQFNNKFHACVCTDKTAITNYDIETYGLPCFWYSQAVILEQVGPCEWHCNVYPLKANIQGPHINVIIQGSFCLSVVTNTLRTSENGHVFYLQAAVCTLCFAWNLTWGFGFPMSKLYSRACGCVSKSHSMSRDGEGAGLWLLSSMCQAGGGALWRLYSKVLQRTEVLPKCRGWITFAAAHTGLRTMWTNSGLGFHKSRWAGYKR